MVGRKQLKNGEAVDMSGSGGGQAMRELSNKAKTGAGWLLLLLCCCFCCGVLLEGHELGEDRARLGS